MPELMAALGLCIILAVGMVVVGVLLQKEKGE